MTKCLRPSNVRRNDPPVPLGVRGVAPGVRGVAADPGVRAPPPPALGVLGEVVVLSASTLNVSGLKSGPKNVTPVIFATGVLVHVSGVLGVAVASLPMSSSSCFVLCTLVVVYTATLPPFPAITAGEDVRGLNSGKEENFSSKLTVCRTLSIPSSLVALRKNLLVEFGVVGVIIIGGGMQEDTLLWLLLMLLEGFIPEVGVVILCCGGGRLVEEEGCCVSKLVLFCGGSNLGLTRCC